MCPREINRTFHFRKDHGQNHKGAGEELDMPCSGENENHLTGRGKLLRLETMERGKGLKNLKKGISMNEVSDC